MQKTTRNYIFTRFSSPKQMAIAGMLLAVTVGTSLISLPALADKIDSNRKNVKCAHWKLCSITHNPDGTTSSYLYDSQIKFPDKWRIDRENGWTIKNGAEEYTYNKEWHTYHRRKDGVKCIMNYGAFLPQSPMAGTLDYASASKRNIHATFKGKDYAAIELTPNVVNDKSGKAAEATKKEIIYIDPDTELMRAYCVQQWDAINNKWIDTYQSEFEYSYTDIYPDSLFDIHTLLPADAKEEE